MNPATAALVLQLLEIGERAYVQLRAVFDREHSGNPLTDAEIAQMKSESDAAHQVIQSWTPPS